MKLDAKNDFILPIVLYKYFNINGLILYCNISKNRSFFLNCCSKVQICWSKNEIS